MSRDVLLHRLSARLDAMEDDALAVMDYIAARLEVGRDRYGGLDLSTPRDWAEEERQEHADAVVYRAAAEIVRLRKRQDPVAIGLRELAENAPHNDSTETR